MEKKVYFYDFPIGRMGIADNGSGISDIFLNHGINYDAEYETELIKLAAEQLYEYFDGKRKIFDFPLSPKGTEFQKKVWGELLNIPYGQTASYCEIASRLGNKNAARAVGMANNRNPIIIVVPCHRVIGSNGSLVGYGEGLDVKQSLLELERKYSMA